MNCECKEVDWFVVLWYWGVVFMILGFAWIIKFKKESNNGTTK